MRALTLNLHVTKKIANFVNFGTSMFNCSWNICNNTQMFRTIFGKVQAFLKRMPYQNVHTTFPSMNKRSGNKTLVPQDLSNSINTGARRAGQPSCEQLHTPQKTAKNDFTPCAVWCFFFPPPSAFFTAEWVMLLDHCSSLCFYFPVSAALDKLRWRCKGACVNINIGSPGNPTQPRWHSSCPALTAAFYFAFLHTRQSRLAKNAVRWDRKLLNTRPIV